MSHNFLSEASFHSFLEAIDQEFVSVAQAQGCRCGGRLHHADYPRSPLGMPAQLRETYEKRFSLCCDTCRRRITPPSVRFFGRRWVPAPLFLFLCVLTLGINERRLRQIQHHLGIRVSESTWKRWRRWWRDIFPETAFWQAKRGLASTHLDARGLLPRSLLALFRGTLEEKMRLLLRFLAPLSSGISRLV